MSDRIRVLPDAVANQIAAGEVIQRPASVVKELVENAIDAGSTDIRIVLKNAGKTLIQVIDNGMGMSDEDARIAFARHATSKIREANDLFSIRSFGFRGEALASIAAIAEVTLRTRRPEDELGTEVRIAASVITHAEPVSCPAGSHFTVKNIFYNIPVRRKFLKSDTTELNHCLTEFRRIALTYPRLSFSLTHNKTELFHLTPCNTMQRIEQIFGSTVLKQLIPIETNTPIVHISGYVGKPEYARKTPGEQFFFANGRFVRHAYLHKAIVQAFALLIPAESIPVYFITLEVEPEQIDINIHPTKIDVKFENEQAIFQILLSSVKEALGKFNITPPLDFESINILDISKTPLPSVQLPEMARPTAHLHTFVRPASDSVIRGQDWGDLYRQFESERTVEGSTILPEDQPPARPYVADAPFDQHTHIEAGQGKYIVTAVKSGLMVIHRKRAYERILYESFIGSWDTLRATSQQCMFPETVELSRDDFQLVQELQPELADMGFDLICDASAQAVVLQGQPGFIGAPYNAGKLMEALLDEYRFLDDPSQTVRERLLAALSKLMALSYDEANGPVNLHQQSLTEALLACAVPHCSPSGKKIIHMISADEMESWFRNR